MFVVFALLCALQNDVCRPVMLPQSTTNKAACDPNIARQFVEEWLANHPVPLRTKSISCLSLTSHTDHSMLPDDRLTLSFTAIAPGVYVHIGPIGLPGDENKGNWSNIAFVIGQKAVAVIDSGGSRAVGEATLRAVRQVTTQPVRFVILGHMHPDHVYGATVFQEAGAQIVAHHALDEALQIRAGNYHHNMQQQVGLRNFIGSALPEPDIEIKHETTLDLGGRSLRLTPFATAHTNNDLVVLDVESHILFTSDLVFLEHIPVLDGALRGWQSTLEKLSQIPAKKMVPGHGPVAHWPTGLAATRDYLDALAASTKDHLKAGLSLSDAAPFIGRSQAPNWQLFDAYHTRNATAAYTELEWE